MFLFLRRRLFFPQSSWNTPPRIRAGWNTRKIIETVCSSSLRRILTADHNGRGIRFAFAISVWSPHLSERRTRLAPRWLSQWSSQEEDYTAQADLLPLQNKQRLSQRFDLWIIQSRWGNAMLVFRMVKVVDWDVGVAVNMTAAFRRWHHLVLLVKRKSRKRKWKCLERKVMESMGKGEEEKLRNHQPVKRCSGEDWAGAVLWKVQWTPPLQTPCRNDGPYGPQSDANSTRAQRRCNAHGFLQPGTACPRIVSPINFSLPSCRIYFPHFFFWKNFDNVFFKYFNYSIFFQKKNYSNLKLLCENFIYFIKYKWQGNFNFFLSLAGCTDIFKIYY